MKWNPSSIMMMIVACCLAAVAMVAEEPASGSGNVLYIDRMDDVSKNEIGGRNSVYLRAPSRAAFSKAGDYGKGEGNSGLKVVYDKKNEGGPTNDGGFCGFYTLVKKGPDAYLDASQYKFVTLWVRGEKGGEKFKIGAADKMLETMDDSVKSRDISEYLPAGKVTTEWQLAAIPVEEFFVDWKQMHAFSICFEADLFETGAGQGTIYVDDLALVKTKPQ